LLLLVLLRLQVENRHHWPLGLACRVASRHSCQPNGLGCSGRSPLVGVDLHELAPTPGIPVGCCGMALRGRPRWVRHVALPLIVVVPVRASGDPYCSVAAVQSLHSWLEVPPALRCSPCNGQLLRWESVCVMLWRLGRCSPCNLLAMVVIG
jgi:hypothetical protein